MRDEVLLYLNGRPRRVRGAEALSTVANWLRGTQHSPGTKIVCEEGDCGACTVLVGRERDGGIDYVPVNSCIQVVAQLDATHVVTVEGVAAPGELSTIQAEMIANHGAQCGYCTPGFIVAMTALAEEREQWSEGEVRTALTGNLCRCTGYEPIIKAAMKASGAATPRMSDLYPAEAMTPSLRDAANVSLSIDGDGRRFFAPATLDEALRLKAEIPNLIVLQGGTDLGVLANKRGFTPPAFLNLSHVRELDAVTADDSAITLGANVTLARLEKEVERRIPQLFDILRIFGAPQIRNAGTVAGNIANGSPIADTLPYLFVSGAEVEATSVRGSRRIPIRSLYRGYKLLELAPDELITRIVIPVPKAGETLRLYKVSKRRDLDISAFTAAFLFERSEANVMSNVRIAFGGVGPTVLRMQKLEEFLEGVEVSEEVMRRAGALARAEIAPISDVRGSAGFRLQLAENILMKLYWELQGEPALAASRR